MAPSSPPKPRFPPFNPAAMPTPSLGALDPGPGINSGYGLPGLPGGLPFGPYGQSLGLPFAGVPGIPIMGAPPSLAGIGAPLGTAASILGAIPGGRHHHTGSPATQAAVQAAVQAAAAQPGATPATIQAAAQAAAQSTAATSTTTPSTTSTTGTQPATSTSPTSSTTATSTTPTTTTPASTTTTGTSTQTPASTSTTTSGGTIPGTTISLPPQSQQNTQLHQWNQRQQQFGTQQPTQTAAQQQLNQWNQQQSNLRNQWNQQQRFGGGFNRGGGGQTQFGGFNRSPLQQQIQQFGSTGGFGFGGGFGGISGAPGGAGGAPAAQAAPTSTATRTSRYAVARMARADRWYPESDAEMNLEQKSMLMSRGCQCSLHYDRPPVVMVYNFPFVHGANFQPFEQVFVRLKLVVYGDEFWENEPHVVHDARWVTANEYGSFVSLFEVDASFKMAGLLEAHGTQSDKFARQRIEIE